MPFTAPPPLQAALEERGYSEPTPVQAAVLEPNTLGRDLLVSAQTGSGKTVAYGLAMAPELLGSLNVRPRALEDAGYSFRDRDVRAVLATGLD